MSPMLAWHLLESTIFATVVSALAVGVRKRSAESRYILLWIAAAKFALPAALFSVVGAYIHGLLSQRTIQVVSSANLSRFTFVHNPTSDAAGVHAELWLLLGLVWLSGTLYWLTDWFCRLLRPSGSSASAPASMQDTLLRMQRRIGYRKSIELHVSETQLEPSLSGVWRHFITIPAGVSAKLSQAELDSVILHELAHAKRRDNLSGAFVHALVCLFWFHPLLWWIERRMFVEREFACDELVLRSGVLPDIYIASISKICRLCFSDAIAGISGVTGSNLQKRMEAIMSYPLRKSIPQRPVLLFATLAAAMTLIPLVVGLLSVSAAHGQAKQNAATSSGRANSQSLVTCVSGSKEYPEGAVIQEGDGPEQMCAGVLSSNPADRERPKRLPQWIRTNQAMRHRSETVIHLPQPKAFFCKPKPYSSKSLCSCESAEMGFSPGAVVNSESGDLRCENGSWRTAVAKN